VLKTNMVNAMLLLLPRRRAHPVYIMRRGGRLSRWLRSRRAHDSDWQDGGGAALLQVRRYESEYCSASTPVLYKQYLEDAGYLH
jgi:hypothetical protein